MIQRVLANPIAGYVFARLTGIERRLEAASEAFSPFQKKDGEYVSRRQRQPHSGEPGAGALLEDWLWSALHPDDAMGLLVRAQAILKPVLEQADFEWTDDMAAEILTKIEHIDPSPEFQVTAGTEGTDPGPPETWVN
jgi:hypothetical protein